MEDQVERARGTQLPRQAPQEQGAWPYPGSRVADPNVAVAQVSISKAVNVE